MFNLTKRHFIIGVGMAVVGSVFLWHSQNSLTPKQISSIPINQLKVVYITKGPNVFPLEPAKWEGLVQELGKCKWHLPSGIEGIAGGRCCA